MPFTPYTSLLGGLILSASTSSLLSSYGRVFGVSGVTHSVLDEALKTGRSKGAAQPTTGWKWAVFAGLVTGGALLRLYEPSLVRLVGAPVFDRSSEPAGGVGRTILAGLLVGAGTKLGSGCTSGHMLCGVARLSIRSVVATATFFAAALLTSRLFPSPLPLATAAVTPNLTLTSIALLLSPALLYNVLLTPRVLPARLAELSSSFLIGLHFSVGLALAGMTAPSKVLGFFEFPGVGRAGMWDPSLMMVAVGGLGANLVGWVVAFRGWDRPRWSGRWELPTRRDIDVRLLLGSAAFGIGWGLRGICPGPLLANLGAGAAPGAMLPFFGAFAAGGLLAGAL